MKVVIDIEANGLDNPDRIWLIVCKDIETNQYHIFREDNLDQFNSWSDSVELFIGHNILGYDLPVLNRLLEVSVPVERVLDTLIISKLVDYPRVGHSIADYGAEFGEEKIEFNDFSKYSKDMEEYCIRDVDICHRIYGKYWKYLTQPEHQRSIALEHQFQLVVNQLHDNGFAFNTPKASKLLEKVTAELAVLDAEILAAFQPKLKLIREVTPRETKYGTISLSSIPKALRADIHEFTSGAPFSYCTLREFNPSSHSQIISVLNEAGWSPVDKTTTHIETEREVNKLKHRKRDEKLDATLRELYSKLQSLQKTGWKVNENNLETLPPSAPVGARLLAKRITLEARRRTLTEWLELTWHEIELKPELLTELGIKEKQKTQFGWPRSVANDVSGNSKTQTKYEKLTTETISNTLTDYPSKTLKEWLQTNKVVVQSVEEKPNSTLITVIGRAQLENFFASLATATSVGTRNSHPKCEVISSRIHGKFGGLGTWSHRMNHQNPNTANIPNEFDTAGKKKLYGKELRSFWMAPKNRLLVGVDAEGIQLRIFAHYINDPEFTEALVNGRKEDKTDPHSLNQRILGDVCRSRAAAKRYIYALLLGAGQGKLREILDCSAEAAAAAYERLLLRYTGFALLKETTIPRDGKRGWFSGLDGRRVRIPGDTESQRRHLAMSGYLQNGEAVVMKSATLQWWQKLEDYDSKLVNFVHDEWQVECPNNLKIALEIAELMSNSLKATGEQLGLRCPLAGSYWNDDLKDYTIDTNWSKTH